LLEDPFLQVRVQLPDLLLGSLAVADVAYGAGDDRAFLGMQRAESDLHRKRRASIAKGLPRIPFILNLAVIRARIILSARGQAHQQQSGTRRVLIKRCFILL